jgi:hypothetical protein
MMRKIGDETPEELRVKLRVALAQLAMEKNLLRELGDAFEACLDGRRDRLGKYALKLRRLYREWKAQN